MTTTLDSVTPTSFDEFRHVPVNSGNVAVVMCVAQVKAAGLSDVGVIFARLAGISEGTAQADLCIDVVRAFQVVNSRAGCLQSANDCLTDGKNVNGRMW